MTAEEIASVEAHALEEVLRVEHEVQQTIRAEIRACEDRLRESAARIGAVKNTTPPNQASSSPAVEGPTQVAPPIDPTVDAPTQDPAPSAPEAPAPEPAAEGVTPAPVEIPRAPEAPVDAAPEVQPPAESSSGAEPAAPAADATSAA